MEISDKMLLENNEVSKLTRIISSNIIAAKDSNIYGFNDARFNIVKKYIAKIKDTKNIIDAITVVQRNLTQKVDTKTIEALQNLKKDAMLKWLEKNRPDIKDKDAYFMAYELNNK